MFVAVFMLLQIWLSNVALPWHSAPREKGKEGEGRKEWRTCFYTSPTQYTASINPSHCLCCHQVVTRISQGGKKISAKLTKLQSLLCHHAGTSPQQPSAHPLWDQLLGSNRQQLSHFLLERPAATQGWRTLCSREAFRHSHKSVLVTSFAKDLEKEEWDYNIRDGRRTPCLAEEQAALPSQFPRPTCYSLNYFTQFNYLTI